MQQISDASAGWQRLVPTRKPGQTRTPLDLPVEAAKIVHDSVTRTADVLSATKLSPLAMPFRLAEAAMRPALLLGETLADTADAVVHGVRPSRAFDTLKADDAAFLDPVFDDGHGWSLADNGEAQGRMKTLGRRGFCETHIQFTPTPDRDDVRPPVERALGMLREAWATREGGTKHGYKGTFELLHDPKDGPDAGKLEYYLFPTGKLPVVGGLRVHETQLKGLPLPGGGLRVPIVLEGGAEGLAYIDLRPAVGGRVDLYGRFAGVEPGEMGELFGPRGYITNHTLVERGDGNEIPGLGRVTPDNGGLLGMIKDRGWDVTPVGHAAPSTAPKLGLRDLPLETATIAQDGMRAMGELFDEHRMTAPMAIPFKVGALLMSPAVSAAGWLSRHPG